MKHKIYLLFFICILASCNEKNLSCEKLTRNEVCVVVKNRSGLVIEKFTVTNGLKKSEITRLLDGENGNISLFSPGESSLKLEVLFDNGKMIEGSEGYVEGGYTVTEIIHKDSIVSQTHKLY